MLENRIAEGKIDIIPQGMSDTLLLQLKENALQERTGCLKIGYVGRVAKIKGCHLLVEAMKEISPAAELELHIYGCDESKPYVQMLHQLAGDDKRLIFHSTMPAANVLREYAKLDVLCIPSLVFETGPLTLFEGIYSGCRVYGSTQIGQMATLRKYGSVVEENTSLAWSSVFREGLQKVKEWRLMPKRDFNYRTMSSVAEELLQCIN